MRKCRRGRAADFISAALVAGAGLAASAPAYAEAWKLGASVSLRETYSDNVALASSGSRSSDWITEVSPRLSLRGGLPRFKVNLDYTLSYLSYLNDSTRNRAHNTLALGTDGSIEVVDNFLFLDARANVSESAVSALGAQPTDASSITGNRTEVRTATLSPYIRGVIPGGFAYEVRNSYSTTSTDSAQFGTTKSSQWTGRIGRSNAFGALGWNADYSSTHRTSENAPDSDSQRLGLSLNYALDRTLSFSARAGRETNNFAGNRSATNIGAGVNWQPTPRTSLSADRDRRFFGNGYSVQFSHRMPLSAYNLGFSRDISTSEQLFSAAVPVVLLPPPWDAFVAGITDPVARQAVIDNLIRLGIAGIALDLRQFFTNRILVSQRAFGSFSLRGARNSLTASASRSTSESASSGLVIGDNFDNGAQVTTQALSVTLSHSLSPQTSANATVTRTSSSSDAAGSPSSRQNSVNLTLSSRLGAKTNGTLGLRHTVSSGSGGVTGYQESAVIGTLNYTFF